MQLITKKHFRVLLTSSALFLFFSLLVVPCVFALNPVNGIILEQEVDEENRGYTVLRVWGSHYQMGYAHASLLSDATVALVNDIRTAASDYAAVREAMDGAVWKPDEIEEEFDGMVAALAETHPEENIDKLDLKALNGFTDWSYRPACISHSCWGSFVQPPLKTLSSRRLDLGLVVPGLNHHVLCLWQPDDGSPSWLNLAWAGIAVTFTAVNEYGTMASQQDYNSDEGTVPDDPLPRPCALRYILTLPDDSDISTHLTDGFTELQNYNAYTASFMNYFTPEGHGGVITCSRDQSFYDLRVPQPTYFNGEVLITGYDWTDGTYTPIGGLEVANYYEDGGPKDLAGHWAITDPHSNGHLQMLSVAYRGQGDMTIWAWGLTATGYTPRLEYEWEDLFGSTFIAVGPGPAYDNPPDVRAFLPFQDASHYLEFPAYGPRHFGVNVSSGDVDGDGVAEILTGPGPGAVFGPHVRGFYAVNGSQLPGLNFMAYGTNKWGVNVAAGDIDGDGFDEIITGAGPGAVFGPHVRAFNYDGTGAVTPIPGVSFFAYGTPKWGVNVAAGDIDGDGYDEIVTGAGPGAVYGPHVRGWNYDGNGPLTPIPGVSFFAYGTQQFGVNVGCGDLDGDGIAEIVTGPGPGVKFSAHVRGWNYDGASVSQMSDINFFAWPPGEARYGTNVFAGADLNGDGRDEMVVGAGPDSGVMTPVKAFLYDGTGVSEWFSLQAFPEMGLTHGTNVAAGRLE